MQGAWPGLIEGGGGERGPGGSWQLCKGAGSSGERSWAVGEGLGSVEEVLGECGKVLGAVGRELGAVETCWEQWRRSWGLRVRS